MEQHDGDDPDKCVFFHCGNWAQAFLPDITIATAPILGTTLGEQNTYGALDGRTPQGPVTFGRVSTDDREGCIRAYVGQGQLTDDPLKTFGTRAVVHVPELQKLMRFICRHGFEHHAAMNASHSAGVLAEAMGPTFIGTSIGTPAISPVGPLIPHFVPIQRHGSTLLDQSKA